MALDVQSAFQLFAGRLWHHDFEIVPRVRTPGRYDRSHPRGLLGMPADMAGMSVADVGASIGHFSFRHESEGRALLHSISGKRKTRGLDWRNTSTA